MSLRESWQLVLRSWKNLEVEMIGRGQILLKRVYAWRDGSGGFDEKMTGPKMKADVLRYESPVEKTEVFQELNYVGLQFHQLPVRYFLSRYRTQVEVPKCPHWEQDPIS